METKVCSKCGDSLPLTNEYFYWRNDSQKFRTECKKCNNQVSSAWAKNNSDRVNAYCREQRAKKPGYYNAICKRYRDRNPEKRYEICTKWRKENPEKSNEIQKRSYTKRRSTAKGNLDHRMEVSIQRALNGNKAGRS